MGHVLFIQTDTNIVWQVEGAAAVTFAARTNTIEMLCMQRL